MQIKFEGNQIKVDFQTSSPRKKVPSPLKAITNASKRDVADGEKDELKRKREGMPLTLGTLSGTLYIFLLCFLIFFTFDELDFSR